VVAGAMILSAPAAAGGGCHATGDPTAGRGFKGVTVPIEECMFTPTVLYVDPGAEVTWVNKDPVPHTVSGVGLSWGTYDNLGMHGRVTHTFKSEGVFPYYCLLHPSMVGAVVVGDPAASKAAAEPIDTDISMMGGTEPDDGAPPEAEQAVAPVSTSTNEQPGAPWLLGALIAVLGVAAGATMRSVKRARAPSLEA
jgi:plastocyanin